MREFAYIFFTLFPYLKNVYCFCKDGFLISQKGIRRDEEARAEKGRIHLPATATFAVRLIIDPESPKDASHW